MLPHFRTNPYQELLADAIERRGVRVALRAGRGRALPIWRAWLAAGAPRVLHLHWTHPYLGEPSAFDASFRERGFLLQLATLRRLGVRIAWTLHNLGAHDGGLDAR